MITVQDEKRMEDKMKKEKEIGREREMERGRIHKYMQLRIIGFQIYAHYITILAISESIH